MNSSAPTALFVLGVTLVFVFCTIIYPMPLLYAALFTVGAGLSLYLFKDVPLKLLGVKQRRKEELSAGNTAPQLDSATSNLPVMTVGRQQVTVPPVTYPPYQRTVPTFARAEAQRTEQVRNPRENNDPAHLAGMGMSTADEALRERLIKILSAIPIPHALNLEKLHALGMWEYPTIQELLQRASKSLDKVAEYVLSWAGIYAPRQDASTHILYSGQTGGGKTTILKHLMIQVLFHVGYGRNQRAVVYDPKNDMLSFLYAFVPKKAIKVLNPLDARCVAWDMAKDIVKPTEAQTLAAILIPKEKDDKPFFPLAAQMIVHGVITSFICTTEERRREGKPLPVQWTLRHLCWAIKRKEIAKAILSKHELTKDYMRFLDRENADVELTAQSYLLTLEAVAAAWDGREKISLLDWIEDTKGQILVLGSSAENKEAITALNTLIVERLNQIVLSQPDIEPDSKSDPRLTSFFLDEFADLKMPSLVELLKQGRSKGARVALTFQSYNSIKKNYGEEDASVIADNCLSQVFLYSIGDSAKWISENIGKERKLEVSYGKNKSDAKGTSTGTSRTSGQASSHTSTHGSSHTYTSGYGGGNSSNSTSNSTSDTTSDTTSNSTSDTTSSGTSDTHTDGSSVQVQIQERDVIMPGDLSALPSTNPQNGLTGYARSPQIEGKVWKFHYDWSVLEPIANLKSKDDPNFIDRFESEGVAYQFLRPLDEEDYRILGIEEEMKKASKGGKEKGNNEDPISHIEKSNKFGLTDEAIDDLVNNIKSIKELGL